jgi:hypothetical protein
MNHVTIISIIPVMSATTSNPFTPQIILLDSQVLRLPGDDGFKQRLIVLFVLNGLVILLGFIYLTLIGIDLKRKEVKHLLYSL